MPVEHILEVHAIELVATEDDVVICILVMEMLEVLTNGIGGSLIPGIGLVGLLGSQDFNKAVAERVENIRIGDVIVQGGGVELGQDIDLPDTAVDTVGDGNVHQTILTSEGYGRL
jgi:hypothetical protein